MVVTGSRQLVIAFVLSSIDRGGAERQLLNLARGLTDRGHRVVVVAVRPGGRFEGEFRAAGVEVMHLTRRALGAPLVLFRLAWLARRCRVDVLHGYMLVGNILTALLKGWTSAFVVFGVRGTSGETPDTWLHRTALRIESRLSRSADAIVVNSRAAADDCDRRGFPSDRTIVIHNGIDLDEFAFYPSARRRLRTSWGWDEGLVVVGRIARFGSSKDYPTFVEAAARAVRADPTLRFVCVGDGVDEAASDLLRAPGGRTFEPGVIRFLPGHPRVADIMSALDIHVLSSVAGESFPNVVCEALACGVPSVVTEIAAAPMIAGDEGRVVPLRDPEAMAEAIVDIAATVRADGDRIRNASRSRAVSEFPAERMVDETESVLRGLR